jgi:hypothetical protein
MRLFKKIKQEVIPAMQAGWASKVSGRVDRVQSRTAAYLNAKTADLSIGGKWIFLVAVCLLFGGFSLYLLIQALM